MDALALTDSPALALRYCGQSARPVFAALFALDTKLGRMVASASQPMLCQIRLAWWREQIGMLSRTSPSDPLLRLLQIHWLPAAPALVAVVEGWELLLGRPVDAITLRRCMRLRSEGYTALAQLRGILNRRRHVEEAVRWWVAADTLQHLRLPGERSALIQVTRDWPLRIPRLPSALRPITILAVLGQRAVLRGGDPPLSRRTDALVAARVGLFGR